MDGKGILISEMKTEFIVLCVNVLSFFVFKVPYKKYELCLFWGPLKLGVLLERTWKILPEVSDIQLCTHFYFLK